MLASNSYKLNTINWISKIDEIYSRFSLHISDLNGWKTYRYQAWQIKISLRFLRITDSQATKTGSNPKPLDASTGFIFPGLFKTREGVARAWFTARVIVFMVLTANSISNLAISLNQRVRAKNHIRYNRRFLSAGLGAVACWLQMPTRATAAIAEEQHAYLRIPMRSLRAQDGGPAEDER